MNIRIPICVLSAFTALSSMAIDDNVVVQELNETYTVRADKGLPTSVKKTEEMVFCASRADDYALATTFYDNDSKIDKTSAPGGVKPFYTSWESDGLFHTGARICVIKLPLKKDKPTKVAFEQTITKPEKFTDIYLLTPRYSVKKATYTVNVPAQVADLLTLTPKNLPDGVEMVCTTNPKGDKHTPSL